MVERRHMRGQKAFLGMGRLCHRERPAGVAERLALEPRAGAKGRHEQESGAAHGAYPIPARAFRGLADALAHAHAGTLTRSRKLLAERLPSPVPWRGQEAELLHQAKHVNFNPLLHDLAVHNPVDVNAGKGRFLPRWWDPLKLPFVLGPIGIVDGHHVALRDEELGGVLDIEGGEVDGEEVLFLCIVLFSRPSGDQVSLHFSATNGRM
jgi:hypothetical protein